jgi:vancomycin resistance protein VanW
LYGELISENVMKTIRIEERNHLMKQQLWGGYSRHNQIVKIETNEKGNVTESLLVENHALMMYNPFLSEKT